MAKRTYCCIIHFVEILLDKIPLSYLSFQNNFYFWEINFRNNNLNNGSRNTKQGKTVAHW